jgi:hypothetical protein
VDIHWNAELLDQLDWHWDHQLRPRLNGITDDEYFWQPVPRSVTSSPGGRARGRAELSASDHAELSESWGW